MHPPRFPAATRRPGRNRSVPRRGGPVDGRSGGTTRPPRRCGRWMGGWVARCACRVGWGVGFLGFSGVESGAQMRASARPPPRGAQSGRAEGAGGSGGVQLFNGCLGPPFVAGSAYVLAETMPRHVGSKEIRESCNLSRIHVQKPQCRGFLFLVQTTSGFRPGLFFPTFSPLGCEEWSRCVVEAVLELITWAIFPMTP
eukprot:gene24418-biopygen1372